MRRAAQQRRIALLAILASSPGGSISRDRVLGILWPERDERSARHLLADSLYILRRTLGNRAITAASETLRLSPDLVWTDTIEFRRALAEGRWSDALELYRGDFLDGFNLRNAPDFDRWAFGERSHLRASATRAASELSDAFEREGRISEAIAAAERRLELAVHDEAALRHLVRLHNATGNRARAAAIARGFVERLALELGIPASRETMRLAQDARVQAHAEPIVVVPPRDPKRCGARTIDSVTASLIARGRHHWHQRTRVSVERALDYFTQAVGRDDRAVDAWCGLADSWVVMAGRRYAPLTDAIKGAEASAGRAQRLDDTVSIVSTSIGGINILRRRWREAEAALRHAILLDPENANARHWLALTLLTGFGDRDTAIREQTISVQLDPVVSMPVCALGWQRYLRGEHELARSEMRPAAELNPDFEEGHAGLARVAARLGDDATVATTIAAGLTRRGDLRGDLLAEHASALAVLGDATRARQLAHEASAHGAMPLNLALAWATLGDADQAFRYLQRDSLGIYWAPQAVWWDPRLDGIRDDVRFRRVLERVERVWLPAWS
jgi:DNA-binding SARP family transcriptional activator/Flp pilus assembly protein TadD